MSYMDADDIAAAQEVVHPRIAIRRMAAEVSEITSISVATLYGPSRQSSHCRARELLCYMAHRTGYSFPEIGAALARHHTTVMHAVNNEKARRRELP